MNQCFCISQTWNGLPIDASEQVFIELARQATGLEVQIRANYYADPPPHAPEGPFDGLWDFEVVELFLAHGETYTELEMGPEGHYLLLRLQGIRQAVARALPLDYQAQISGGHWSGKAVIPWAYLPPEPWTFNAYAIHGTGEQRRYLALFAVPGPEADFHRLHCFQPLPWPPHEEGIEN